MFQRPHFESLKKIIQEPRRFIQVLVGPRQVGKTTLALQISAASQLPHHFVATDAVPAGNAAWLYTIMYLPTSSNCTTGIMPKVKLILS